MKRSVPALAQGLEGAGVYLHVPFCSAVCPYCDFAVVRSRGDAPRRFAAQVVHELELHVEKRWQADTVYLGGGTPSALRPDELGTMLEVLARVVELAPHTRLHLEVNPEDVTAAAVAAWRDLGVVFLSLGVQSFEDRRLRFLGRRHRGAAAERAVALAVAGGFETVNVDVIYALPGESFEDAAADFERAAALGATHISAYELTIHEGTPFARWRDRGGLVELEEEAQAQHLVRAHELLAGLGFEGYEVSNFARGVGHRSAHNQKYWRHVPYLGIGPSAHSFDGVRRWWNHRDLSSWAAAVEAGVLPIAGEETIGPRERLLEGLMLGLRTSAGIDLAELEMATGIELCRVSVGFERALEAGLVILEGNRLRPSVHGMALADRLALELTS